MLEFRFEIQDNLVRNFWQNSCVSNSKSGSMHWNHEGYILYNLLNYMRQTSTSTPAQLASQSDIGCYITYPFNLRFIYTLLTHLVCCWSKEEVASMGVDNSFRFRCTPRRVQYVQHVLTVHRLRRAVSGLSIKSLYKTIWKTNGWVTIYYSFTVPAAILLSRKNILLFNMVLVITCSIGMSLPYIGTVAPVLWATNTCFTQSHPSTASSTIAFSGIILPSRTASLAVITVFAWAENKVKNISLPSHKIENGGGGTRFLVGMPKKSYLVYSNYFICCQDNWFTVFVSESVLGFSSLEGLLQAMLLLPSICTASSTSDLANNWNVTKHVSPENNDNCASAQYCKVTPVWVAHTKTSKGHTLQAVACFYIQKFALLCKWTSCLSSGQLVHITIKGVLFNRKNSLRINIMYCQ